MHRTQKFWHAFENVFGVCAGAAREFPQAFVDDYLRMVKACAEQDRTEVILRSTRMGFLTGNATRSILLTPYSAPFTLSPHIPYACPSLHACLHVARHCRLQR